MAFMVLDSEVSYTSLRRSRPRRRSLVQSDDSEFCIGVQSMLLTSTGVISRSQQEESVLLLRKIGELNKNSPVDRWSWNINPRIETAIGTGQVSRTRSTKVKVASDGLLGNYRKGRCLVRPV